eukprot:TRINITY_DN3204_c0_g1_i12.p2 TRINITY_DN3204_c0_g1~~TRINITY_DN3204_c0_g1_i12.p2  ORF type:complete len:101 (+),score=2.18 TRINITY_DN3204_c0_g1_i12:362-664(+)
MSSIFSSSKEWCERGCSCVRRRCYICYSEATECTAEVTAQLIIVDRSVTTIYEEEKDADGFLYIKYSGQEYTGSVKYLSLIHICRCRRYAVCRSRWSPYH